MEKLNDNAIIYFVLNNKKPRPYSYLGQNYTATYVSPLGLKKMQYQSPHCEFRTDSIDKSIFWSYGSGCQTDKELIGGKYMQFFPLD